MTIQSVLPTCHRNNLSQILSNEVNYAKIAIQRPRSARGTAIIFSQLPLHRVRCREAGGSSTYLDMGVAIHRETEVEGTGEGHLGAAGGCRDAISHRVSRG